MSDKVHILLVNEASPWDGPDWKVVSAHHAPQGAHKKGRERSHESDGDSEVTSMMAPGYAVRTLTIED